MNKCKDCKEWYNKQKGMDYISDYGICIGTSNYGEHNQIKIVPTESLNINYDNQDDGKEIKEWMIDIYTHEDFGCNKFVKRT